MAWFFGKKKKEESTGEPASVENASTEEQAVDEQSAAPDSAEPKKGFFGRIKQALVKTYRVLNTDIKDVFKEGRLVDDDFLKEIFAMLIKTDMGAEPAARIRDAIGKKYRARRVEMNDFVETAKETIREIMDQPEEPIAYAESGPTVIMVCGVNGAGKTTSIAKLTNMFIKSGKSVVLGAGDTFRAAAVEQLTIWANRLGAEIVTGKSGGDPASVSYQAVAKAVEIDADICIVDTAGRLQTQTNLMDQLTKIRNVMQKVVPEAPHECLLVLDATAGQNAISQAKGFGEAAGCSGIVLAKLDGSAKGGVAIPIRQEFGLPVKYIGLGEKEDDIALFNVETFVEALFDSEE